MEVSAHSAQVTNESEKRNSAHLAPSITDALCLAIVASLAVATYAAWLDNYLVADSWSLIGAISQPDWTLASLLPFQAVPHRINSTYYYAPVSAGVLWGAFKLGGYDPQRYHLISLLMHVITTLLLYGIARRMTGSRLKATLAASIFAVHFASTEAVGWFGGYTHPLVGLFGSVALACYLQFLATRHRAWQALSLTALTFGALTQATAFSWFAVIALLEIMYGRTPASGGWKGTLLRLCPIGIIPVAVLPMQIQAFHMGPSGYQYRLGPWLVLNLFYYPVSTVLPSLEPRAFSLARDLQLALSQQDAFARLMGMPDAFSLLMASAMSVLVGILLWTKGGRTVRFMLISFVISLTPFLLVNGQGYRYLYTPLIFFSIGIASAVVDLARYVGQSSRWSSAAVLAVIPVFVVLSFAESQRQMFWWQQAGFIAHDSLQQLRGLQPVLPKGAKLVFGDVPDTIPGTNAEIWRQGFGEALQVIYDDRALRIEAYSRPEVERLFREELKDAPDTYGFVWEDWHFRKIQP